MLGLKLRDEFLGAHMPGTAIALRTNDNQGAAQKSADHILSITYPTSDVQSALRAINAKRSGRPVVLMGERGRGKSHIMAVMHHAIQSPDVVEVWAHGWGEKLESEELKTFAPVKGFIAISEPVHNYEYPLLWDLLFDRHPKGQYYRGQFEQMSQPYPPRTLLEKMFKDQPTCLILDEFQTWFTGLPEKDPKTGFLLRQWASNFVQNLSEIAKDLPEILILVISVLNNDNEAFQQVHRVGPFLVHFRGPTAKQDRQRLVLHRLFENRDNISRTDIVGIAGVYANERFRLLYGDKSDSEKDPINNETYDCWPFSPELINLLEDHILLSQAAQETRDLIRILAQVYRSRGDKVPVITPADFFVDSNSDEVQSLVDSIAVQAGQEKLRQIAQRNLEALRDAGVNVLYAGELVNAIWLRSMSPGKTPGGTPDQLHLDITRQKSVDDNAFQVEIELLTEHSVNIHGDEVRGGPLWFGMNENPRSKVRAFAKNNKLWQQGPPDSSGKTAYPRKDLEHVRNTLRHILVPETVQPLSRVIVLGPNWNADPWNEVDEADKPPKWDRPLLLVIPEQIEGGNEGICACLGAWLAKYVQKRRNTVRFLLLANDKPGLYTDSQLLYSARCSFLCSREAWGADSTYRMLHQDFDRTLRQSLKDRFNRFAILRKWDFQEPGNCVFEIEKIPSQGADIHSAVEEIILTSLFDMTEFKNFALKRAHDSDFVGSLMDDLMEPAPPNVGESIPFLGETKLYELLLQMAAHGDIVLNVGGTWIGRRAEDESDEEALRYIRTKAFRTGQEMRQIQLSLPGSVGGGTVTAPSASEGSAPLGKPSLGDDQISRPHLPTTGNDGATGSGPAESGSTISKGTTVQEPAPKIRQSGEPALGINLSACFEQWGVSPSQSIDSAKVEFIGLTAQQIKQILQRIPSTFKGTLEITYREGGDQ